MAAALWVQVQPGEVTVSAFIPQKEVEASRVAVIADRAQAGRLRQTGDVISQGVLAPDVGARTRKLGERGLIGQALLVQSACGRDLRSLLVMAELNVNVDLALNVDSDACLRCLTKWQGTHEAINARLHLGVASLLRHAREVLHVGNEVGQ